MSAVLAAGLPVETQVNLDQDRQLARLTRKVNALQGLSETKTITRSLLNTGIGSAGHLAPLDVVAQGDTSITRSGLSIRPIAVEWNLVLESEVADAYNLMRMMIVQSRSGPLALSDFAGSGFPIGEIQKNNMTILFDSHYILNNDHSGTGADPLSTVRYSFHHGKVKIPRAITYANGSSDSDKNNLYVFFVSDSTVVNHPDVEVFNALVTFKDN